ncbi:MAG TPA: zinc-dependent metalloprotease family protein, partial [Vicinamibacteria bacterium]|nr:zinc-dependent metalloprotease family protein [Vicinamibacteria bacterium]
FHGGTVPLALAAVVVAVNRVNTVYERDLAVHLNLVANNDQIIYTAEPDPYTNNDGVTMLTQNQTNLTNVIGAANYDVGHVFSTGGGGVASLGVVCNNGAKARGVTGLGAPTGDPFYIDYVAHEMGHQFRGNHSFNGTTSACGGGNRSALTAWEPGSGSTIMAYAGICGAENLQSNSDDLFHVGSLVEIQTFVSTGGGSSCPTTAVTGNAAPIVDGGPDFTIPQTTPFTLTATGSDPNGEPLVYIWEQMNVGTAAPPNTDNGNRAIFRSFDVSTSPSRTFPKLADVLAGTLSFGEAWPTTDRSLSFRVTARDNHPGAGGTTIDPVVVTVVAGAGPFEVTSPNTSVTWTGFGTETVTWSVANTQAPPISAANVRISLSTDGGSTFPTVLAASTPNDGSEDVAVPNTPTAQARVKVEAVGNVFFDIGNANFNIVPGGGPNASIADVTVTEGNAGNTPALFTVSLSGTSGSPITVDYATANGTATVASNDYLAASGTLTFAPGQTSRVVTVSVVGDLTPELNETFFVNLSNLTGGGTISDGQGVGTIVNDDGLIPELLELTHGSVVRRSLASVGGQQKRDDYRLAQKPLSSYEVAIDEASGDLSPIVLQRLSASGTSVLQSSQPAGTGPARTLRFENSTTTEITNQVIRVSSGGCTTNCGTDDTYRIRAYETTLAIPRFNNSGSQITVLILQNPTNATINAKVYLWNASGAQVAFQAIAIPPRTTQVVNTSLLAGGAGTSGAVTLTHDGAYGALVGKTVALEPSTGFSFDSPMQPRPR